MAREELVPLKVSPESQRRIQLASVVLGETQPKFMDRVVYDFFNNNPVRQAQMEELANAIVEGRQPLIGADASREEIIRVLNLPESDAQEA